MELSEWRAVSLIRKFRTWEVPAAANRPDPHHDPEPAGHGH